MSAVIEQPIAGLDAPVKIQRDFLRFEFKYILRKSLREEIETELNNFLTLDPFVASKLGQKYFVRSLYFDDPTFSAYYDKIDGLSHRAKFRLRTYINNPDAPCDSFLEIKGRHNQMVFKKRAPLIAGDKGRFYLGEKDILNKLLKRVEPGYVRDRFYYESIRKLIKPVMLIDYHRRPYISRYSHDFRITFDDHLHSIRTECLHPENTGQARAMLRGYTVMEVKFQSKIPVWFHRIIKNYHLKRVSISKICAGIDAWNLVPRLE